MESNLLLSYKERRVEIRKNEKGTERNRLLKVSKKKGVIKTRCIEVGLAAGGKGNSHCQLRVVMPKRGSRGKKKEQAGLSITRKKRGEIFGQFQERARPE